jgi:hypothetical protein
MILINLKNGTDMKHELRIQTYSSNPLINYVVDGIDVKINRCIALYEFERTIIEEGIEHINFDKIKFTILNDDKAHEKSYYTFMTYGDVLPLINFYCHFIDEYNTKKLYAWSHVLNVRYEELLIAIKP